MRIDPNTGAQKVKIYKDSEGNFKGDALISFENIESVETAIEMLDKSNIRPDCIITVQPAEFEMKGDEYRERKRQKVDLIKKKQIAAEKSRRFAFSEEQAAQIGLKICILKHLFTLEEVKENPNLLNEIDIDVRSELEAKCGKVSKFEIFHDHPDGVIKVKFENTLEAEACIELMNGRLYDGREITAEYWDGKEDFKRVRENEGDLEQRVNDFGDWLNDQDLPEELQERHEGDQLQDENGEYHGENDEEQSNQNAENEDEQSNQNQETEEVAEQ